MDPPKTPILKATKASEPTTSTMPQIDTLAITLSMSRNPTPSYIEHHVSAPPTPSPSPATLSPAPVRDPDTLGSLIEIRDSEDKGLGVFALCDIPPRTILLCESPLVTLQDDGARVDPLDTTVNALSPEKKKVFFSLYSYSRNKNESLSRSIVYSNGYSIMNDLATGLFETASRINHSCVPNSHYTWKESIGKILFWNRFKLLAGEEVTVDYGHKKKYLKRIYGFDCVCGGCTDSGSDARSDGFSTSGSESGVMEDMARIDEILHEGNEGGENI
ncbi:SET domain-containing protein [Cadophora sp. DSE1049]|nr:SET domain-containing protein [Cadophora sp. DSE1049]